MQLLDPLQIDDGHDADGQIGVLRHVHLRRDDGAVQPFVEQQIGVPGNLLPVGERARLLIERFRFLVVVQVAADLPAPALAIAAKQGLELLEHVVLRAEVAVMLIALRGGFRHLDLHGFAVVAMKGVAFDQGGSDAFAPEYPIEGARDGCGAGA